MLELSNNLDWEIRPLHVCENAPLLIKRCVDGVKCNSVFGALVNMHFTINGFHYSKMKYSADVFYHKSISETE